MRGQPKTIGFAGMCGRARAALFRIITGSCLAVLASCTGGSPRSYEPCYPGAKLIRLSEIQFDDGDTFYLRGRPIRILGIDTPETADPDVGIFEDQPFGIAAAESTRALIARARVIEYAPDGRDTYDRLLAHVFVDGELLAVYLIRMGLAYETVTQFGDNGFPDLAQRVVDEARRNPKPRFEPPYKWRRKHQRRVNG